MNVGDLFTNLSLGELSNLCIGDDGAGDIPERFRPRVINHANAGLIKLYSRFVLSESQVLIEQQEGRTTYPIKSTFAESKWDGTSTPLPFINDIGSPFTDDIIKITDVYDSLGRKLTLNDEDNRDSLFTPQPKVLFIPRAVPGVILSVTYQAKHPPISLNNLEQELELPEVLNSALTAYVGWQIYAYMNTQEAQTIAAGHQQTYEAVCQEAVDNDSVNTSISSTNIRFRKGGWR